MKSNNIIAKTARLESASELLSAEMGKIIKKIVEIKKSSSSEIEQLKILEKNLFDLEKEKRSLSIEDDAYSKSIIKKYGVQKEDCVYASGF